MKKKLQAFTITELMVVMLISTITITAAFSAYSIIDKQFRAYGKDNEKALNLSTIKGLLSDDFLLAKEVQGNKNGIRFQMDNDSIIYAIHGNYIVRKNSILNTRNDTFAIKIEDSVFRLNNTEVENGLIDFAAFKIRLTPKMVSNLSFSKRYSSADLFEYYGSKN